MGDNTSAAEIEKWSCANVAKWLRHNGLHHVAQTFVEQRVDGYVLLRVTDTELATVLNCRAFGDRKRILEFVEAHQPQPRWPRKKPPSRPASASATGPATPEPAPEPQRKPASRRTDAVGANEGGADSGGGSATHGNTAASSSDTGGGAKKANTVRRVRSTGLSNNNQGPMHSPIVNRRRSARNNGAPPSPAHSTGSRSSLYRSTSATNVRQRRKYQPERPKFRTMATISKDRLGGPGPGGSCRVPSFAEDNKRSHKGVRFGHRIPDPQLKFVTPAPGGNTKVPSFARDAITSRKGVRFGTKLVDPPDKRRTPAPGGNMPIPSFVEDNKRQRKGVVFGTKLATRREIETKLGYPIPPAPGGNVKVPSFAMENQSSRKGVVFGRRTPLKPSSEPVTPAPGGNVQVPSFARENIRQKKGVPFGHRLKSKQEIALACGFPQTPAPGGNCRVPSFVHDSKVQNKGVRFGTRTLSWKEIERKLGIPEPPAPGGNCRVPSFVRDNIVNRKGAQFGWKVQPPVSSDVIERMDVDPLVVLSPGVRKRSLSRSSTFSARRASSGFSGAKRSGGGHSGASQQRRMRRVQSAGPTRRRHNGWSTPAPRATNAGAGGRAGAGAGGNSRRVTPAPTLPYNEQAFEMELGVPMDLLETAGT